MVNNILVLKNSPVVTISYVLNIIKTQEPEANVYVLAHEHAVESMKQLVSTAQIVPYFEKDILRYASLTSQQRRRLRGLGFAKIYFVYHHSQKNGFENLLILAALISNRKTKIVGIDAWGVEIDFPLARIAFLLLTKIIISILSIPMFALAVMCGVVLISFSLVRYLFSRISCLEK